MNVAIPTPPRPLEELVFDDAKVPEHNHAGAQLCGLDSGLAIMETAAGSWLCPPGRCLWVPPEMTHSLRSCGKMSGWMLYMDAAISEGLPAKPQVLALSPLLKQIVSRIRDWVAEPKENAAKRRIVEVLRDEIAAASEVQLHLPMPKTLALKRLSARLADNSTTTKKLAALAREMGVSERSLFRKFQKETGLSHGQWRRQTQVLRSIELLADGRSVTEAALEVGYATTGAFIRTFRRVVGVTPTSYAQR